jgi:hypothetical protein
MTSRLMAFVKDRAGHWLPATEFEQFGRQAWRTRISDARKRFEAVQDGTIENRVRRGHSAGCAKLFAADLEEEARCDCGGRIRSEYRYVPRVVESPAVSQAGHDVNRFDLR